MAGAAEDPTTGEAADARLGQLLVTHQLLAASQVEAALARCGERGLARLLLEEDLVPRYAVETLLALGGAGLRPLQPGGGDPRAATTGGALGSASGSADGLVSWPDEVFQAPGSALLAPRGRLGPFELGPELGRGGGGWVFRATDTRDGSAVALKVLRRESAVALLRFQREGQAVARLRHPHIARLLGQGQDEGRHWLAFELVRGRPLQERCAEADWTFAQAARVVRDAARAVQHAHEQGVLHRDLKPGNLLVDAEGRGRVLDFGLARLADGASPGSPLTSSGAVLGSVRYMAPEQAFPGRHALDERTDVWGLGATLYHALTGRPPFERGPLPGERLPAPRTLAPGLPAALERVVLGCLQEDPAARYPGAGAVADDLERFLRGEAVRAAGPGLRRWGWRGAAGLAAALLAIGGAHRLARAPAPALAPERPAPAADPAREEVREAERLLRAAADARGEDELLRHAEALGRLAARPAARTHLIERLDALTERLRLAGRAMFEEAEEPDPVEMARGEAPLRGLGAALREARAGLPVSAAARLEARLARQTPGPLRAPGPLLQAQAEAQAAALGPGGLRLGRVLCLALGRVADHGLQRALARYLDSVADEEQAIPAARALIRTGSGGGLRVVLEALRRFGPGGRFAREAVRGVDGAEQVPVDPSAWADLAARGDLCLTAGALRAALRDYRRAAALAPTQALLWNRQGLIHDRLGEREQAARCFDLALALAPDDAEARLNRARHRREAGDGEGAEADARRALAGPEQRALAWVELASQAAARGELAEAIRCCDRALAEDPREASAWNERGSAHLGAGRLEAAEADYARAVELEPHHFAPWRNRALVRARRGDRDGARADANRSLDLAPTDPHGWTARGDVRASTGDAEGALADYGRAIELDAACEAAWTGRGNLLREAREWEAAVTAHTRAIELAPERSHTWLNRAAALQGWGRLDEARADLDRALELDPREVVAWSNRAGLRLSTRDLAGAEADAERALALLPDHTPALLQRALVRLERGQLEEAGRDLDRAIALEPRLARAWLERGRIRYQGGLLAAAEADFSRALELDPLSPIAWSNRGALRHRQEREAEALADLDRALELDPRQSDAWANRALVLRALGRLDAALADADRALELDPGRVAHLRNRALIRVQRGELDEAEADLTRALEWNPRDPDSWQARASLRLERGDLTGAAADVERLLEAAPARALAARALRAEIERARRGEADLRFGR